MTEILPDARFRVQLDAGREVVAYMAGKMKKNRIKTLVGDRVTVEMSPYDLQKGRLIFRHTRMNMQGPVAASPCAISFGVAERPDDRIERADADERLAGRRAFTYRKAVIVMFARIIEAAATLFVVFDPVLPTITDSISWTPAETLQRLPNRLTREDGRKYSHATASLVTRAASWRS